MNILAIIGTTVFVIIFFGTVSYGGILEYKELNAVEDYHKKNFKRKVFIIVTITVFYLVGIWFWWHLVSDFIKFEY